ncbi:hypothetical protein [Flavobacterium terrisoli]|uniref:hypothetical protein n=1 Tax=Flavobacterium terrisoli TaxID=3242195 RepID=UPI0025433513|nr:hypothetical protein [Flavobacterium buctense]
MKKYFFVFIFLGLSTVSYSQNIPFTLQKSALFQDEFRNSVLLLSEKNDKGELLLVRSYEGSMVSQATGYYIEYYDDNLKFKRGFEYEMKHPNYQKYNLILGVFTMGSNLHFVEIYYDLNEKMFVCLDNVMAEDFKITPKELFRLSRDEMKKFGSFNLQQKFYARSKEVWTNDNVGAINAESELANLDTYYQIFFSGNATGNYNYSTIYSNEKAGSGSDIVLVVNETKSDFAIAIDVKGAENDGLKLYLFDKDLNKKMDLIYTNEAKDKKCFFQNIQVSDDGNAIYVLAKAYDKDLKKKTEGGKYYFELTKVLPEKQVSQKIAIGEHFLGTLKTYYRNDELTLLGLYSDQKDFRYTGIFCSKVDTNTLETKSSHYNPFTEQFLFDKYGTGTHKNLKNIRFKKIFFKDNGEIILNAEEEYVTSNASGFAASGAMPATNSSSTYYSYDDIIIAQFNAEGSLLWARNINKKQTTTDDENSFISYTSAIRNDKTYFFINTKDKIKKLKNDRIEFGKIRKNKSNLNIIEVNANGDFDYQEILDDEQNEVPFMVAKGVIIDNNVYLLGRKGKNKQLLKITL